jgi:hypothetical protein
MLYKIPFLLNVQKRPIHRNRKQMGSFQGLGDMDMGSY